MLGPGVLAGEFLVTQYQNREARTALLKPDIRVEHLGFQSSTFGTPVACLRVTFADATNKTIALSADEIPAVLNDPQFPKGFSELRTTLCQAHMAADRFQQEEQERQARKLNERITRFKNGLKSFLGYFLPPPPL